MMGRVLFSCMLLWLLLACAGSAAETPNDANQVAASGQLLAIWPDGIGNGLGRNVNELGFAAGPAFGTRWFAGWERHDFVLGRIDYARLRTGVLGDGPLRGSLEARLELWGGGQTHPEGAYLVGLTPALRYNVATGTRWMPFVDGGAGVTLTDIGLLDLCTTFEFNLQGGAGCYYFLKDDLALMLQYRFVHLSNGHIDSPNVGVNANAVYIGLSRFF